MASTRIILEGANSRQLDEKIAELVAGLIATENGLRQFVMAVEKVVQAITADDYPMPPDLCGEDHRAAAIYEGYRLGAEWMAKLLLSGGVNGLDITVIQKEQR
jgi:hypothetical protein